MRQKIASEMELAKTLKFVRTNIRLKHTLAADDEINEKCPPIVEEFLRRLSAGQPYILDLKSVIE